MKLNILFGFKFNSDSFVRNTNRATRTVGSDREGGRQAEVEQHGERRLRVDEEACHEHQRGEEQRLAGGREGASHRLVDVPRLVVVEPGDAALCRR